jgi:hypothetical protein
MYPRVSAKFGRVIEELMRGQLRDDVPLEIHIPARL